MGVGGGAGSGARALTPALSRGEREFDRGKVRAELTQDLQRKLIADYIRDIRAKADVKIIEQQAGAAR